MDRREIENKLSLSCSFNRLGGDGRELLGMHKENPALVARRRSWMCGVSSGKSPNEM
jgi:hypothetical protein